jgi:filamentous hemagglutinin family protein
MTYLLYSRTVKLVSVWLAMINLAFYDAKNFAEAQVVADDTLGSEKSTILSNITINNASSDRVDGGAIRGSNLFHSFLEFNVSEGRGIYFTNPTGVQNIISRVTGHNSSKILGKLGVIGNASLFLINPNGILFGPNASLDLGGSFVATTADAVQFGEQGFFSAVSPETPSLLTVNPSAFLLSQIRPGAIENNSIAPAGQRKSLDTSLTPERQMIDLQGLRVPDGKSLILLGRNIALNGSGLNALGGRIELASVTGNANVELTYNDENLSLSFPENIEFGDVFLRNGANVDTSGQVQNNGLGQGGGEIRITGQNIQILNSSQVISETTGPQSGKDISIYADGTLEVSGNTQLGALSTLTSSSGTAGNIKLSAQNIVLKDQAQVVSSSSSAGAGGDIIITASESIDILGEAGLFSSNASTGAGGDIIINSLGDFVVKDFAAIVAGSGFQILADGTNVPASGTSGNIVIQANNSVLIDSGFLFAGNQIGKAGSISINTKDLKIYDGEIAVSSEAGEAGNINFTSNFLSLDKSVISGVTANSISERGGANIDFNISGLVKIENESSISAEAINDANGGNITINTPILLVLPPSGSNGSDIVATAKEGKGGNILVNAQGIFGIKERTAIDGNQSNDIDASSEFGTSGNVELNAETNPSKDIVELPSIVVDPSALVAQTPCKRGSASEFTRSGRGGLPPSLAQDLNQDATQVGLVEPIAVVNQLSKYKGKSTALVQPSSEVHSELYNPILPAQGWVFNDKGQVILVANNPSITGDQRLKAVSAGCSVP